MTPERSVWCLVANVTREPHPEGPDGELRIGTKHFAPGAKLYCFPSRWGDGGERVRVLGRHRSGGPRLIEAVVATKCLTNWRVQQVFQPFVVNVMEEAWGHSEVSRERALAEVLAFEERWAGPR